MNRILFLLLCIAPASLFAYGPRSITSTGAVVKWQMPVTVNLETDQDVRGKDVSSLVEQALQTWENVPEADVTITRGTLNVAVDQDNACDFLVASPGCPNGPTSDGLNPLVIDEDGEITEMFFGVNQKFTTLGFASIVSSFESSGLAVKGEAVFNAACLESVRLSVSGCTNGEDVLAFTDDDFISFVVHEMGHFLGLNHSQVNLLEAENRDPSTDNLITTMHPFFAPGNGANFRTLERDDRSGIASLYPSANFASTTWTLTGTVYDTDGTTEFQCANVIARNQADPKVDAISFVSGQLGQPNSFDGSFEIQGLTPGATYTLEVEPINSTYTASSGLSPCTGIQGEPSPPQFDAQTLTKTFTGSAGQTVTGADITLTNTDDSNVGTDGGDDGTASSDSGGCSLIRRIPLR